MYLQVNFYLNWIVFFYPTFVNISVVFARAVLHYFSIFFVNCSM